MTPKQVALVRSSWSHILSIDPEVVGTMFYNRLFEIAPHLQSMFHRSLPEQSRKLMTILDHIVEKLDALEEIIENIVKLSQRHSSYGVKPEHFADVGEALLWTLEKNLGRKWNKDIKEAWAMCFITISSAMINAVKYIKLRG